MDQQEMHNQYPKLMGYGSKKEPLDTYGDGILLINNTEIPWSAPEPYASKHASNKMVQCIGTSRQQVNTLSWELGRGSRRRPRVDQSSPGQPG
eukprot:6175902-Pleurochrysis_carterae.AAC.1